MRQVPMETHLTGLGTAARIYGVSEDRLRRWIEESPE
jgi:hypothetical protein